MPKDIKQLKRLAEEQGWTVEITSKSHLRFLPPDKTKPQVFMSGETCSHAGFRNGLSQLRRAGLVVSG